MKKTSEMEDELRPEYDFSQLTVVARGPGRRKPTEITVKLAADVAKSFPTSKAVNKALRLLVRVAKDSQAPASR
jgi:hypothetical protein